jgi:hypothetical protein
MQQFDSDRAVVLRVTVKYDVCFATFRKPKTEADVLHPDCVAATLPQLTHFGW